VANREYPERDRVTVFQVGDTNILLYQELEDRLLMGFELSTSSELNTMLDTFTIGTTRAVDLLVRAYRTIVAKFEQA
jgi:hypothetical protein